MNHYKGVQIFTFRHLHGNVEAFRKVLGQVRAIGYDCVHGWLVYPDQLDYQQYSDLLEENGLRDCGVNGGDVNDIINQPVDALVRGARILGTKDAGVAPIPVGMMDTAAGFRYFAQRMNEAGKKLYEADGISVSYHSHAQEFASFGGTHGMDIFFEETDPRYVHFVLDTHWIVAGGCNPAKWIRKAGERVPVVHFKDYRIVPGANRDYLEGVVKDFAEVGQGNIDWPEVVQACRDVGVRYYIVEQDQCPGNPLDSLQISFDKLLALGL